MKLLKCITDIYTC